MPFLAERKKQSVTPVKELENKKDEEDWALKDVVFVEDVKTVPIGKVIKVWHVGLSNVEVFLSCLFLSMSCWSLL